MTSKERAKLKSIASKMDTILQIGKNPIGEAFLKQVKDALKAREMIKIHVLETCELTPAETASALAETVNCEVVQVIGSKVILFKHRSKDDKKVSYLDIGKPGGDKSKTEVPKERGGKVKASIPKEQRDKNRISKPQKDGAYHGGSGYKTGGFPKGAKPANKGGYGSGKRTGKK